MLHRFYSYCHNYESNGNLPVSSHLSSLGLQYQLPQSPIQPDFYLDKLKVPLSPYGFPVFKINFIEVEGKWRSWNTVQPKEWRHYAALKMYIPFNSLLKFCFRSPTEVDSRYLPLSIWAQCHVSISTLPVSRCCERFTFLLLKFRMYKISWKEPLLEDTLGYLP